MQTTNPLSDKANEAFIFAQGTAQRLQEFGESLHGLASVQAVANPDASITMRIEYFANDATREGEGDAYKLFGYCADMGLLGESESAADGGKGAFGPVEVYSLS